MDRSALKFLKQWALKEDRKPLLLRGARQVGKTWLVRELGKTFKNFVEVNLESEPELHPFFAKTFGKPDLLIEALELKLGCKIDDSTLFFIDEIQECPEALLALRYFREKKPGLAVIAAGSLVEFALKELSFPVGRIETAFIFPISFSEYLQARGLADLRAKLQQPYDPLIGDQLHASLLAELRIYMLIGGMPEVVSTFLKSNSLDASQEIQQQLVSNFRFDFNKYASRAKIPYLRKIFDESPRQLGKKFIYSHVSSDMKSREVSDALQLLVEAGLLYQIPHSSGNGVPLSAEAISNKFKVFFVDIGLCNRLLGLKLAQELLLYPETIVNRGGLAEQFVAQELLSKTPPNAWPALHYWHREKKSAQAEVDFLWEINNKVVPIEVKSGKSSKTKSLRIFMQEKQIVKAIRLSTSPQDEGNPIMSIPLYFADEISRFLDQG